MPALAAAAYVSADAGDLERAATLVGELLAFVRTGPEDARVFHWIYPGLYAFEELGRAEEVNELLEDLPGAWIEAARLHLGGDLVAAADLLGAGGDAVDEARTRLAAAERFAAEGRAAEAQAQLDLTLAFYRSVGASLYVRRAERLLAASA
jgi:hypothetical protein